MAQKTARYLIQSLSRVLKASFQADVKFGESIQYLIHTSEILTEKLNFNNGTTLCSNKLYLKALRYASVQELTTVATRLQQIASSGSPIDSTPTGSNFQYAWNECQVDLVQAAKSHIY